MPSQVIHRRQLDRSVRSAVCAAVALTLLACIAPACREAPPPPAKSSAGQATGQATSSGTPDETPSGASSDPGAAPAAGGGTGQVDPAAIANTKPDSPAEPPSWPPHTWFFAGEDRSAIKKGIEQQPAPELSMTDWVGERQSIAELKGNIVVLWFWAANRTQAMRTIPRLRRLADDYREQRVVIIGVHENVPSAETIADAAENYELNFPVGVDFEGMTVEAYAVNLWPTLAVIDHEGNLRAAGLRPSMVEIAVKQLIDLRASLADEG